MFKKESLLYSPFKTKKDQAHNRTTQFVATDIRSTQYSPPIAIVAASALVTASVPLAAVAVAGASVASVAITAAAAVAISTASPAVYKSRFSTLSDYTVSNKTVGSNRHNVWPATPSTKAEAKW